MHPSLLVFSIRDGNDSYEPVLTEMCRLTVEFTGRTSVFSWHESVDINNLQMDYSKMSKLMGLFKSA